MTFLILILLSNWLKVFEINF